MSRWCDRYDGNAPCAGRRTAKEVQKGVVGGGEDGGMGWCEGDVAPALCGLPSHTFVLMLLPATMTFGTAPLRYGGNRSALMRTVWPAGLNCGVRKAVGRRACFQWCAMGWRPWRGNTMRRMRWLVGRC